MLSAFTARPIIELKQRDKSKIESILAYGSHISSATAMGNLLIKYVQATASSLA
jgi:hypothetical protein